MKLGTLSYSRVYANEQRWQTCGELYYIEARHHCFAHIWAVPIRNTLCCKPMPHIDSPPFLQGDLIGENWRGEEETYGLIISSDTERGSFYTVVLHAVPLIATPPLTLTMKEH